MCEELVYEKKYPVTDLTDEYVKQMSQAFAERPIPEFDQIYEKAIAETTLVPIPARIKEYERFIRLAIEISKLYELSTKIVRHSSHITVNYAFPYGGGMYCIRHVFGMADTFAFFAGTDGNDITISMDYYTHAVVRNGRIVAPCLAWCEENESIILM